MVKEDGGEREEAVVLTGRMLGGMLNRGGVVAVRSTGIGKSLFLFPLLLCWVG